MRKSSDIAIMVAITIFTVYLSVTLMQSMSSMKEHKEQTKAALESIERRMDALGKTMETKITANQLSGHLIGVRTSLKEILKIIKK